MDRGSQAHGLDELNADAFDTPLFEDGPESWPSLGGPTPVGPAPSWAAKAVGNGSTAARAPPPPDVDTQEWPELSKAASTPAGQQPASGALDTVESTPVPNALVKVRALPLLPVKALPYWPTSTPGNSMLFDWESVYLVSVCGVHFPGLNQNSEAVAGLVAGFAC
jgi:hypothetical protein